MIYFDNAATTMMKPPEVAKAVAHAINHFGSVGRGVHEASLAAATTVFHTREQLAALFGAPSPSRVSFMANATEALNCAICGLLGPDDNAITSSASHNSVLRPLYRKQEDGVALSVVPVRQDGSLDYEAFEAAFTTKTRLVVMTHASNVTGEVYDIARISRISHSHNAILVVDAAQTAGAIPIDMQAANLDVVVFTGHKSLFGPQGTGGICVREGLEIKPLVVGGSGSHSFDKRHPSFMPEALEAGTLNSHGIAGLSAGIDYINAVGITKLRDRTRALVDRFLDGVEKIESAKIYGHRSGSEQCGIVALNIGDLDAAQVCDYLNIEHHIMTRPGAHCAPLMHEALGTADRGIVRFSFSPFNTPDEVDQSLKALGVLANQEKA